MGIFDYIQRRRTHCGDGRSKLAKRAGIPLRTLQRYLSQGEMPSSRIRPLVMASRRAPVPGQGAKSDRGRSITVLELVRDLDRVRLQRLAKVERTRRQKRSA